MVKTRPLWGLLVLVAVVSSIVNGCQDEILQPREPETDARNASQAGPSPGLRVAPIYRALSDAQLDSLIESADRRVFITFKEPGAAEGVDRYGTSLVSKATRDMAKSELRARGLVIEWEEGYHPTVITALPRGTLAEIRRLPFVDVVEPVLGGRAESQDTTWNVHKVRAPEGWWFGQSGGVKVLVIDTGIGTHLDLHATQNSSFLPPDPPAPPHDIDGHGTHVAGIIAALDNGNGIIGVAPSLSLYVAKALWDRNNVSEQAVIDAISWGIGEGVDVINMSLSLNPSSAVENKINQVYTSGIVLAAAAGNCSWDPAKPDAPAPVVFPANLDNVIAVGAVDDLDQHWRDDVLGAQSCRGSELEVVAPGKDIESTWPGDEFQVHPGTSTAAPHVAAAVALLKARNPTWSNEDIRQRLRDTAAELGEGEPELYGDGRIDIARALDAPAVLYETEGQTTWRLTDQFLTATSPTGPEVRYSWRFDIGGSFTDPSPDTLVEFAGHGSPGTHTVTLKATNTTSGASVLKSHDFSVVDTAVTITGETWVTTKQLYTYVSNQRGNWYERLDPETNLDWLISLYDDSVFNRIWAMGHYTIAVRNDTTLAGELRRRRLDVHVCWDHLPECDEPMEVGFGASSSNQPGSQQADMFGAGPWISAGSEVSAEVVRFYDLTGLHEPNSPFASTEWLKGRGGETTDEAGRWMLKWRNAAVPDPNITGFEFTVTPLSGGSYVFGMAVDPDLSHTPGDDEGGYDQGRGMAYVLDGSTAVGFLLRHGTENALVKSRQFGARVQAPRSNRAAWRAQREPGIDVIAGSDDVQLVLSTADAAGPMSWTFWIVRGENLREIRQLADEVLSEWIE